MNQHQTERLTETENIEHKQSTYICSSNCEILVNSSTVDQDTQFIPFFNGRAKKLFFNMLETNSLKLKLMLLSHKKSSKNPSFFFFASWLVSRFFPQLVCKNKPYFKIVENIFIDIKTRKEAIWTVLNYA